MRLLPVLVCPVIIAMLVGCPQQGPVQPLVAEEAVPSGGDPKGLLGKWRVVAFQSGGESKPAEEYQPLVKEFEFDGNTITITREGDRELWGPFEADAAASPPRLVLHVMLPPVTATYDLKGDRLRICYYDDGDWRDKVPPTLASHASPHSELILLERVRCRQGRR